MRSLPVPAFEYNALDNAGKFQKGILEGDSAGSVRRSLKARGLTLLHLAEMNISKLGSAQASNKKNFFNFTALLLYIRQRQRAGQNRLSLADLTLMTRQLATLVSAGLPIEEALSGLLEQSEKPGIKRIMAAIRGKITDGYSLSAALEQFPEAFSTLYIASVTAGEQTGRLSEVLLKLADHLENQYAIRQKVTQALVYPCMMLAISLAIVIFLLVYIVPKIIEVFQDSNQALPFVTQVLLNISAFFQNYGILLGILIFAGISLFTYCLKKESLRFKYDYFLLHFPFIGYLVKTSNTARFSRTLGILVETGVSVLESMYIALEVVERLPIRQALKMAAQSIREGSAIHTSIKQTGYFNSMSIYLIANGEAAGKLDSMLEKMAYYQEQELTRIINIGLSLFEPILILVMGIFTLFIVLAILLPIFSYNQLVG